MKRFRKIILIIIFTGLSSVHAANNAFYLLIEDFEKGLDVAAQAWMDKNYGATLDAFYEARELLAKSAFTSSEGFDWEAGRSLQTYTLVLSRMAEAQMHENNNQQELAKEVKLQAQDWADKLLKQGKDWRKIHSTDTRENNFRIKWLQRYKSAILKARKLKDQ